MDVKNRYWIGILLVTSCVVTVCIGVQQFCNETMATNFSTRCRSCRISDILGCPFGTQQLTNGSGIRGCDYTVKLSQNSVSLTGCTHTCQSTKVVISCCGGHWGIDCQECPGGADNPCSGHGKCMDGAYGNGTCTCDESFHGAACERCKDPLFYGPNCTKECRCEHGTCHDGVNGNGYCECFSGYTGRYCDRVILSCQSISCHKSARCQMGLYQPKCKCKSGYKGDGYNCEAIDRCKDPYQECDENAICNTTGPGTFTCTCRAGYRGDGYACQEIDPCQENYGNCPEDSTICIYLAPGKRNCSCLPGFHNFTEGFGCDMIDLCELNKTACHEHSNCTMLGPGYMQCTCEEGYVGDGTTCYGNILERVKELHNTDPIVKGQFYYTIRLMEFAYKEALAIHGPFTLFAVTDKGFLSAVSQKQLSYIFNSTTTAQQIIRQHLIAAELQLEELTNATRFYTMQGATAELFYKHGVLRYKLHDHRDKAKVIKGDLPASNGIIHIVDKLLDKSPGVLGSERKTIFDVVKGDGKYNRFSALIKKSGLEDYLSNSVGLTLFAPNNRAWDDLPPGSTIYLMSPEGEFKLRALLQSHIVQKQINAVDLINMRRLVSMERTASEVSVTALGQIQLNKAVNISQTDIVAKNGMIHHVDGVLIPEAISPLLPHRCDIEKHMKVPGSCGPCDRIRKCPPPLTTIKQTEMSCRIFINPRHSGNMFPPGGLHSTRDQRFYFHGCRNMCNKTYKLKRCCSGFYGPECHPCPGGFQKPCGARGQCNDSREGNGRCICDSPYAGANCEFCKDKNKSGYFCNRTCSCVHGECDNRVSSQSGRCKPNTCMRGSTGTYCNLRAARCGMFRCSVHATCQMPKNNFRSGKYARFLTYHLIRQSHLRKQRCVCKSGYYGSGTACYEIDPCKRADRGGCHIQARCLKTGPGRHNCTCDEGFSGDGFICYPTSICTSRENCPNLVSCTNVSAELNCTCADGYSFNGTDCVTDNFCIHDNGGCDKRAECFPVGPKRVQCNCSAGFAGDGYSCYGSILSELEFHRNLTLVYKLLKIINVPSDTPLDELAGNYTFLAPRNSDLHSFVETEKNSFWLKRENVQVFVRCHILNFAATIEDLKQRYAGKTIAPLNEELDLKVDIKEEDVYINDAKIIEGDIWTLNGYIHIIDKGDILLIGPPYWLAFPDLVLILNEPLSIKGNKVNGGKADQDGTILGQSKSISPVLEPYPIPGDRPNLETFLLEHGEFTIFYTYLKTYELFEKIYRLSEYTLFAPTNDAFVNFTGTINRNVLSYYVVYKEAHLHSFIDGEKIKTLLGSCVQSYLHFSHSDGQVLVEDNPIVKPNLLTDGGIVHGISGLLHPNLNRCDRMIPSAPEKNGCFRGHFGPDCLPCPGLEYTSFPCFGRGVCDSGLTGTGVCHCNNGFSGTVCETCIDKECEENNICSIDNGGCDLNAICLPTPDNVQCLCKVGYYGAGEICTSVCDYENGFCHPYAQCSVDDKGNANCTCQDGYHGNGKNCEEVNKCTIANGGCSQNAHCKFFPTVEEPYKESRVECSCPAGLVGDGVNYCNGNLLSTIESIPEASIFYMAWMTVADETMKKRAQEDRLGSTVFIPVDSGFQNNQHFDLLTLRAHVVEQWWILSEKSTGSQLTLTNMNDDSLVVVSYLNTTTQEIAFEVNGTQITDPNIPTTNGVLHLIAKPLVKLPYYQSQELMDNANTAKVLAIIFSVLGVVAVVLVAGVVAGHKLRGKVMDWKSKRNSFFERQHASGADVVRYNPYEPETETELNDSCLDFNPLDSGNDKMMLVESD